MTDTPILRTLSAAVGAGDPASDAELLRRYTGGRDGTAFELLVRRHAGTVWAVCRAALPRDRHAAEDAFQATFLALARKAGSVRGESAGGWLFRVARNAAARAGRTPSASEGVDGNTPSLALGVRQQAERDEAAAIVHEELDRLAAKYREPVVLCFYQGHSHAEAAARLGWPVGTVASRLARAKDRLRARLTRRGVALSAGLLTAARADAALVGRAVTITLGPAGSVPPAVVTLTNGVLTAMTVWKLKLFAAGTAAAVLLTAGAVAMHAPAPAAVTEPGPDGRPTARPAGPLDHLHALHDQLYRWWRGDPVRADNDPKKELKALAGEWQAVAASISGVDDPADVLATMSWTVTADGLVTMSESGRAGKATLAVDPAKTPHHVTMTLNDGPPQEVGRSLDGVYARDGDTLTVAFADPKTKGAERPKEVKPGKGVAYIKLVRVTAEAKKELAALAGGWQVTALSSGGVDLPAVETAKMTWTVSDAGELVLANVDGTPHMGGRLLVAPGGSPARATLLMTDGPHKGKTADGVYTRDGDKWRLAFADPKTPGAKRPAKVEPADGVVFIALDRKAK